MKFFFLCGRIGNIPNSVFIPGTITCNPFMWFFSWTLVVSLHVCAHQYSVDYVRGIFIASNSSFYAALSLVLCPSNSNCLVLSRPSVPSPWLKESAGLSAWVLSILWKLFHNSNHCVHLICFSPLSNHYHSFPNV